LSSRVELIRVRVAELLRVLRPVSKEDCKERSLDGGFDAFVFKLCDSSPCGPGDPIELAFAKDQPLRCTENNMQEDFSVSVATFARL
jgi:hypothetical protein